MQPTQEKLYWLQEQIDQFLNAAHIAKKDEVSSLLHGKAVIRLLSKFRMWVEKKEAVKSMRLGRRFKLGNTIFEVRDMNIGVGENHDGVGISAKSEEGWGVTVSATDALSLEWIDEEEEGVKSTESDDYEDER